MIWNKSYSKHCECCKSSWVLVCTQASQLRDLRSLQNISSRHSHSHSHGSHGSGALGHSQSHSSLRHSASQASMASDHRSSAHRSGELVCRKCRQKYDPRHKMEFKDWEENSRFCWAHSKRYWWYDMTYLEESKDSTITFLNLRRASVSPCRLGSWLVRMATAWNAARGSLGAFSHRSR